MYVLHKKRTNRGEEKMLELREGFCKQLYKGDGGEMKESSERGQYNDIVGRGEKYVESNER